MEKESCIKGIVFKPNSGENSRLINIDYGDNEIPFGKTISFVQREYSDYLENEITQLKALITESRPWVNEYRELKKEMVVSDSNKIFTWNEKTKDIK